MGGRTQEKQETCNLQKDLLKAHPAVWWISKQIRIEREACCDQAGITATGQAIRYAEGFDIELLDEKLKRSVKPK